MLKTVRDIWLWVREGPARRLFDRIVPGSRASRQTAAQARFWTEFRGGQREAEERSAKTNP
jgi:hypothetical protein